MAFQFVNFLDLTLAVGLSETDTQLTVLDADLPEAARYDPAMTLALTIVGDESSAHEIVYVTGRSGSTFTVIRGCEDTVARSWEQGRTLIAAATVNALRSLTNEGSAELTSYVQKSIIRGSNVQEALDNTGALIVGAGLEPPVQLAPVYRTMGEAFGPAVAAARPFGPNNVSRISTNGLGARADFPLAAALQAFNEARAAQLVMRVTGVADLSHVELELSSSDGAAKRTVRFNNTQFVNGEWMVLFVPASAFVQVGSTTAELVAAKLSIVDDGTGVVTAEVDNLQLFRQSFGAGTILRQINSLEDLHSLLALSATPLKISAVIDVVAIGTTFSAQALQALKQQNVGIVLTTASALQTLSAAQVRQIFFEGLQRASLASLPIEGFYLPGGQYGSLLTDPAVTLQALAAGFFEKIYFAKRQLGTSGQEAPWLTPAYPVAAGETLTSIVKAPFESLVLDLSNWSNAQVLALLGTAGASLRASYSAPVLPALTVALQAAISPVSALLLRRTGDRMDGPLSSKVQDHGSKGSVTETFNFLDGNTHRVECTGNLIINPTNLAEGDTLQINLLYRSGTVNVQGTTQFELGATFKSTNIADIGASLVAGNTYRLLFEIVAGVRTCIFQ